MVIEKNRSWGMVIDTDKCNGCSGCVTACQVENNIPLNDQNKFERGRVNFPMLRPDLYLFYVNIVEMLHVNLFALFMQLTITMKD